MDEKTRTNFDLNIWNPGAVPVGGTMEENQIYETCNDFLDGTGPGAGGAANHYCTPVSSHQASTGGPPNPPRRGTLSRRKSLAKKCHSPSGKCVLASSLFVLSLLLFLALGCCGYVIVEVLRLKDEVRILKNTQRADTASLSSSIAAERESHRTRSLELDSKIEAVSTDLTLMVEEKISLLRSDLQDGLGFLSEGIRDNLTLLANLSSLNLMGLVDEVVSNFSSLSSQLEQQDSKTGALIEEVQNTVNSDIQSLSTQMSNDIQELDDQIKESIDELNSTLTWEIGLVASSVDSLETSIASTVARLSATEKGDFEQLSGTHQSDTSRLESLIASNHDAILTSIARGSEEDREAIAGLRSEVYGNVSDLEDRTWDSVLSLGEELATVEAELSMEAHGNLTQLEADIRQQLDRIASLTLGNVSSLETETRSALTSLAVLTEERFTTVESRVQSELSSLNQTLTHELAIASEDSRESLDRLEADLLGDLEEVSSAAYRNMSLFAASTSTSIAQLDNDTEASLRELGSAVNETREQLGSIRLEVARNFTDIEGVFGEEMAQLRVEFRGSLDALNTSTLQDLLDLSLQLDGSIADTLQELNDTASDLDTRISWEVSDLMSLLELSEENATVELQRTRLLLQEHVALTDASFQSLRDEVRDSEAEGRANLTRHSEEATARTTELADSANRSVAEAREELGSDLAQLEQDLATMLDVVNASLHLEVLSASSAAALSVSSLERDFSGELADVYRYVSDNLTEVEVQFNAALAEVEVSLDTIEAAVASSEVYVQSILDDTAANLTSLIVSGLEAAQGSVDAVAEEIRTDVEQLRQDLDTLDNETHVNVTRVENQLLFGLESAGNETQTGLDALRTEHARDTETLRGIVHTNISEATTSAFGDAVSELNTTVSDVLRDFQTEYQDALDQLVRATDLSFTEVRTEITELANATTSLRGLARDLDTQQDSTVVSIDSLDSVVRGLSLVLEEARHNVSALTNGVEQLDSQVQTHLESSVDLFSDCVQDTANCTYTPSDRQYQSGCDTDALMLNVTGYQTLDTRCEFTTDESFVRLEINRLEKMDANSIRCKCSVVSITEGNGDHNEVNPRLVNADPVLSCSLVILRCPLRIDYSLT